MVPPLQLQKVVVQWTPTADNVAPLLTGYKHLPGGQGFGPHEAPMGRMPTITTSTVMMRILFIFHGEVRLTIFTYIHFRGRYKSLHS